jgi:hypothetical protein
MMQRPAWSRPDRLVNRAVVDSAYHGPRGGGPKCAEGERTPFKGLRAPESHACGGCHSPPAVFLFTREDNRVFDELEAQGHFDPGASRRASAFEAYGQLSADGRLYLRSDS